MDGPTNTPLVGPDELLRPISDQQPAGSDPRQADAFDRVRNEISKLTSPESIGACDWGLVRTNCETLLREQAKDIRVATYLGLALFHTSGLPGLGDGLSLLAGLLDKYWDNAFPPVAKASTRADAITWFAERIGPPVTVALAKAAPGVVPSLWEAFGRLRQSVAQRFPDRPPGLGPIERAFEALPPEVRPVSTGNPALLNAPPAATAPVVSSTLETTPAAPDSPTPTPQPVTAATSCTSAATHRIATPISPAQPAGDDPRLLDEFDRMWLEIEKLTALTPTEPAWSDVRRIAEDILTRKSKDLRCLCYWSYAKAKLEGPRGLADAFAGFAQCAEQFGNDLHPRREKTRAGALGWFGERLQALLTSTRPQSSEEELKQLRTDLARVQAGLQNSCQDVSGLHLANAALAQIQLPAAPKPAPAPPPPSTPEIPAPPATPSASGSTPAGASAVSPTETAPPITAAVQPSPTANTEAQTNPPIPQSKPLEPEKIEAALARESQLRMKDESETADSLRFRRLAAWSTLLGSAPSGHFECQAGTPKVRQAILPLLTSKNWPELLKACERQFQTHPYWLDLSWWSVLAAREVLGSMAARALTGELIALLWRQPQLLEGIDRHDQRLASPEVASELARFLPGAGPDSPAPNDAGPARPVPAAATTQPSAKETVATSAATPTQSDPESLPPAVVTHIKAKDFTGALDLASSWMSQVSGRTQFTRQLAVAEQLNKAGAHKLAYPIYRALERKLRDTPLTQWDAKLAASCIDGYLFSKRKIGLAPGPDDERLLDDLALLDPKSLASFVG